jgi:hypothetical protein
MKNVFVFVVCGAKEHIDTLHYSLAALKKFTRNTIVVLTDTARNEAPILHDEVVDVKTPEEYNHHQASIFLKTGIHLFLEKGNTYCYLDTDVIALSATCDEVFKHRQGIINFAPDHCKMQSFSGYAVNCGCIQKWKSWNKDLDELLGMYDVVREKNNVQLLEKRRLLFRRLDQIKADRYIYFKHALKFLFSPVLFRLEDDLYYHRWKRQWQDKSGTLLYKDNQNVFRLVQRHSHFVWNKMKQKWLAEGIYDVYNMRCNHLKEQIFNTFSITVEEPNWQHWNGGLFLFDDQSHAFLSAWHQKTMQIFNDSAWKTRDQGTLIATAWEFGLQDQKLLSKRFNFIADFYNHSLEVDASKNRISDDFFKTSYSPVFVHVFHHFGTKGWDVWDWIENKVALE